MHRLAAQLYSLRDEIRDRAGLASALRRVKEIGYDGVQFSTVAAVEGPDADTTPARAHQMLADEGLECLGAHRGWQALRDDTAAEIEYLHAIGCTYVAVPIFRDEYDRYDPDSYHRFAEAVPPVAAALAAAGIALGYHNHAHEFARPEGGGSTPFDILLKDAPALAIELDVYWVAVGGVDPARLLERLHDRVDYLHVKDLTLVRDEGESHPHPFFAPVGEGNLDWHDILPAARDAGTTVWIVEQDAFLRDPYDSLRSSHDFMRAALDGF
jgi:sugar phosphate isomerase/epimerase